MFKGLRTVIYPAPDLKNKNFSFKSHLNNGFESAISDFRPNDSYFSLICILLLY